MKTRCLYSWAASAFVVAALGLSSATAGPLNGFVDLRAGRRVYDDPYQRDTSLAEWRLQLQWEQRTDWADMRLRSDFIGDTVARDTDIDLERGRGWIDLREAYMFLFPAAWTDIKIGRQILTWGIGDLLFINDLFPKDWPAFFVGRDEEYLKAPSDAIMMSVFPDGVNIDLVYVPRFDADRGVTGRRLSYYHPLMQRRAGRDAIIDIESRDAWFDDDEIALRIYGQAGAMEWAAYAYQGYWKSPLGFDATSQRVTHPRLRVYGASVRTMRAGGILSAEAGYFDAIANRYGRDPLQPNSELRFLLGWQRELTRTLSLGLQGYVESMLNYNAYRRHRPDGQTTRDRERTIITTRLTREAFNQKLRISGFLFYSPSDHDAYLRASARYSLSDSWSVAGGGNLFSGDPDSFFGQFRDNSNLYAALRRSF